jgi:1-aminocyclopropane-1-carboxylate deaminase/D-cysteine desulfhydrase-like pyridoxal-dependent ACC family enzyme
VICWLVIVEVSVGEVASVVVAPGSGFADAGLAAGVQADNPKIQIVKIIVRMHSPLYYPLIISAVIERGQSPGVNRPAPLGA